MGSAVSCFAGASGPHKRNNYLNLILTCSCSLLSLLHLHQSYRHDPGLMGKKFPTPSQLSTLTTIAAAPISSKTTIHHHPPKRDGSSPPPGPAFASLPTGLLGHVSTREAGDSEPQPGQAFAPQCIIRPHFGHSETAILTSHLTLDHLHPLKSIKKPAILVYSKM